MMNLSEIKDMEQLALVLRAEGLADKYAGLVHSAEQNARWAKREHEEARQRRRQRKAEREAKLKRALRPYLNEMCDAGTLLQKLKEEGFSLGKKEVTKMAIINCLKAHPDEFEVFKSSGPYIFRAKD